MRQWTLLAAIFFITQVQAQTPSSSDSLKHTSLAGLRFRALGPAFTGGRIVDIAVNPADKSEYYVASGHGSLWKTVNNGVSYTPVFDNQASYSIGAVEIDPTNSNIVWVGTGENNNQNNVIYGDGIYRSEDGGKSWKNMGLKNSEHIGGIAIDPNNNNTIYVAAYGSLRNDGGDRGLYKSSDGGKSWRRVLHVSDFTGIFQVHMHPRKSTTLYAVAHQRQRKLYTGIRGGAESAVYRSLDSGATWQKIMTGLPGEDVGRMGMAVSPADPNYLYLVVEAKEGGGFYRSTDGGSSWTKQSSYVTSYPFYMNKIVADPVNADKVYGLDVFNQVSIDGGKTWKGLGEKNKHVDNHALYVDPADTRHMIAGSDGGVYETWDGAQTWDFKSNLPIAEIYKITTDNASPFYNVYAGTQDNSSFGGPSRTISRTGITNANWFFTTGGDGFETQVDWKDENIIYAQSQNGGLVRFDKRSGEQLDIKPVELNDSGYRFDWSSPLLLSRHNNKRLYFGANRLLRTNDQGNSWDEISGDLTRGVPKTLQRLMNRVWSMDELITKSSMAQLSSIAESPIDENILYAGSGDGLIHVSSDGGKTWRRSPNPPGLPEYARISQIAPSAHNKLVAYVAADNFSGGNYRPYLYKTVDGGNTWSILNANLPQKGSTYAIAEDHADPGLLFVGTQFGLYFSNSGGADWIQLKAGIPPASITDIEIQRRENDLVVSTFGRGIYILDDYSPLRHLQKATLQKTAAILPIKDAWMFVESNPLIYGAKGWQGERYFATPNPEPGAVITYYVKEEYTSLSKKRREAEKVKQKRGEDFGLPIIDSLRKETLEQPAYLLFSISDEQGNIIRRIKKDISKGVNRMVWDLRYPSPQAISLSTPDLTGPFAQENKGYMVVPGTYKVSLDKYEDGRFTELVKAQSFRAIPLANASLAATDLPAVNTFNKKVAELIRAANAANLYKNEMQQKINYYRKAMLETPTLQVNLVQQINSLEEKLELINRKLNGDPLRGRYETVAPTSLMSRINNISGGLWSTTAAPTTTYQRSYQDVSLVFEDILKDLRTASDTAKQIELALESAGAPFTPGRMPVWKKE